MLNERGMPSRPGSNPGFSASYLSVAKLDKAPEWAFGLSSLRSSVRIRRCGGSSPSGQATLIALGIVAVHLAFNQVTGVRFSQGEPK